MLSVVDGKRAAAILEKGRSRLMEKEVGGSLFFMSRHILT